MSSGCGGAGVDLLVVTNPVSRQNRGGFERLAARVSVRGGNRHIVTPDLTALRSLAQRWQAPALLAVNGGDGTVHHLLTALHVAGVPLPPLALLPGGTTNMTAHDISGRRTPAAALETLLSWDGSAAALRRERCALRVTDVASGDVQVGFFFGAGAIVSGIRYTHERVYRMGIADEIAPGMALARVAWGMARGEPAFSAGAAVEATMDGGETMAGSAWALLITPLQRLFLGLRPFWGTGAGPLHVTLVDTAAPARLRNLPGLLRGRPRPQASAERGYHSANAGRLELQLDGPYTLDGELYPPPAKGLVVEALGPLRFLPL